MAIVRIGAATANFDTRAEIVFPQRQLKSETGYLFFIRTVPITVVTRYQYLNLILIIQNGGNPIETALEAKFFPKGRMLMFSVAVPKLEDIKDPNCNILALPREFYRDAGELRRIDLELLWEDKEDYEAKSVCL